MELGLCKRQKRPVEDNAAELCRVTSALQPARICTLMPGAHIQGIYHLLHGASGYMDFLGICPQRHEIINT